MTSKTSYEVTDSIAVLRLDDGKANAVGYDKLRSAGLSDHSGPDRAMDNFPGSLWTSWG